MAEKKLSDPLFYRAEVAKILYVTPLTIQNREKASKYPLPRRDLNGYRIYSLNDVLNLQLLTFHHIDPKPILSVLYDKGWTDAKEIGKIIDKALSFQK